VTKKPKTRIETYAGDHMKLLKELLFDTSKTNSDFDILFITD
jgi:hypothetical protein